MFNINRPRKLTFDQWVDLANQLSGKVDVSKDDMLHRMEQTLLAKDPQRYGEEYARAECAEGLHRELHPDDPTDC